MAFDFSKQYTMMDDPRYKAQGLSNQPAGPMPGSSYAGQDTGYPANPTFQSILDGSGNLMDQYKLKAGEDLLPQAQGGIDRARSLMDLLKGYATGATGSSPWATAQMNALDLDAGQAMGDIGAQVNAGSRAAASGAASRGGLTAAMRSNLARNAQNQTINAKQGVAGQRLKGRAGIMASDADRQLSTLTQLPGMENQATGLWSQIASGDRAYKTGVDQFNIGNTVGGVGAKNNYDMSMYEQDVKRQAGKEMADATANAGKK